MSRDEILVALQVLNEQRGRPPLEHGEVAVIAESASRYDRGSSVASDAYVAPLSLGEWPEPLGEVAFHGLAGEFVRLIEPHSEADPAALLFQFLIAYGNVIGRRAHFVAEGDQHATNGFVVIVGPTSKARKGSSWGHVRGVFERVDPAWAGARILSGLSSGEGLIWQVRDPIWKREKNRAGEYEDVLADPGEEDKRLLVYEAELASTLRRMERDSNSLSAGMRDAWDRGDLRTLTKNSPAVATSALVSIVGHITKDEANRYLSRTEAANGLGNRFLWICARRARVLPDGGHVPESGLAAFAERLRGAVEFGSGVGELSRDAKARQLWHQVYEDLSEGRPGLLGAMTARGEAQTMRLACLYALLDQSQQIKRAHLDAALAAWRYAEASAQYVFGGSMGDPTADEILRALRASPDGLTRTEIRDLFSKHRTKTDTTRALGLLTEQRLAHCVAQKGAGRPVERWYAGATKETKATELGRLSSLSSHAEESASVDAAHAATRVTDRAPDATKATEATEATEPGRA